MGTGAEEKGEKKLAGKFKTERSDLM